MSVEIEIFSASSYDGVIQALGADQIEFAFLDSSAYAAAYTGTDGGVEPLISRMRKDGTTGYYSVVVTRREDGYSGISDLKGKTSLQRMQRVRKEYLPSASCNTHWLERSFLVTGIG